MQFPRSMPTKISALITSSMIIAGIIAGSLSMTIPVEGQGKRSRRVNARSGKRTGKSASSSRGRTARRDKSIRNKAQSEQLPLASYQASPTYPDNIEVIEHGSSESADLKRLLNMPASTGSDPNDKVTPTRRFNIKMEPSRVIEIQQALADKGFYQGEMNGVYDDSTIDAMRRFQLNEKIPATGYPTAHALRRLGLAKW